MKKLAPNIDGIFLAICVRKNTLMVHWLEVMVMELEELRELAGRYARGIGADNTAAAYTRQWEAYQAWLRVNNIDLNPVDPSPVTMYLTHRVVDDGVAMTTLVQALSAIRWHYRVNWGEHTGAFDPSLKALVRNLRRDYGRAAAQKKPLLAVHVREIIAAGEANVTRCKKAIWRRDKALLLTAWASACRRSELAALEIVHVHFSKAGGCILTVESSKTDQFRHGVRLTLRSGAHAVTCPVCVLNAWCTELKSVGCRWLFPSVQAGHITDVAINPSDIGRIVKGLVQSIGLNPSEYSAHSTRAGWVTDALAQGRPESTVMMHSRHRDQRMMTVYNRGDTSALADVTAAAGL
ncbi:MAG: tyrosine-type recombinase/integrase [Candidatus Hydrogenedentes bacterium]|nr:tyrosine-type recombinase/integrase [Candidatus Hydrogenedentota bacterium]